MARRYRKDIEPVVTRLCKAVFHADYILEKKQDSGLRGRCIDDKSNLALSFCVYSTVERQRSVINPVFCDFVVFLRVGISNVVSRRGVAAHPMDTPCLV